MKLVYHTFLPLIVFSLLLLVFFGRLFFPKPSLFMIPDFGESDVLHLNLPFKEILSTSLKQNQWPLWTPYLASGFPILAEGQIGAFYLPNLILYKFLPTVTAYNLNLVLSFFLLGTGLFFFLKSLKISVFPALFAALVFTFSGFFSVHLNHANLLQTASLLPWVFWAGLELWQKQRISRIVLFAFLFSQQIFSGHFYIVFITLVGFLLFWLGLPFIQKCSFRIFLKKTSSLLLAGLLSLFLSCIQLLPTFELWRFSGRSAGLDFNTVTSYPYPPKHLLTFFAPFLFGNPLQGTYPPFSNDWGIFWENTAYIGLLPILLVLTSLAFLKEKKVKLGWLIVLMSLLLVTGKYSPLYFIFSFPLFNLFRVPSKYLLLTVFFLSFLTGLSLEKILIRPVFKKTGVKILLFSFFFLLLMIDEYRFSYSYPPITPASRWLEMPETARFLRDKNAKIASLGAPLLWNSVFLTKGWQEMDSFVYFRNGLYQNYNSFFQIPNMDINTGGLIPRRVSFFNDLLKTVEFNDEDQTASLSALTKNAISLASVSHVISAYKIEDSDLLLLQKINPSPYDKQPFYLYQNLTARPKAYLVTNSEIANTVEDVYRKIGQADFLKKAKAIVEKEGFNLTSANKASLTPLTTNLSDVKTTIEVETETKSILVLTQTFYPGWKALVDKSPTEIFPVNITQRGILLEPGKHTVQFIFDSASFNLGKKITIVFSLISFLGVFLDRAVFPDRASHKKWP